ncbi:MAG TPA: UDP-N-acetylmuramoyl-L-alanine--D-glutamate ligase, partial [Rikenellaceae bacterium]|nr:UDP-N-acetylmuramoyl-L-alanine--D-glutamate ligase [Rikenellaceae bacterium]
MSRVVILGGGESGVGAAVLAKIKGHETFLSDNGMLSQEAKESLERWKIDYEEGRHTRELILKADEVIKSPGIPDSAPIIEDIKVKGIPVI